MAHTTAPSQVECIACGADQVSAAQVGAGSGPNLHLDCHCHECGMSWNMAEPLTTGHAARAPKFEQYLDQFKDYARHSVTTAHGFEALDVTTGDAELIWVGYSRSDGGRWMQPEEVLDLAAALENAAHAHIARVFAKTARAGVHAHAVAIDTMAFDDAVHYATNACYWRAKGDADRAVLNEDRVIAIAVESERVLRERLQCEVAA